MYQASTSGTGCLGCGLGTEDDSSGQMMRIVSIDPSAIRFALAARQGEVTGLPTNGQVSAPPGMPWWVWGVAGVGLLGFIGAGVWWYLRPSEEAAE
jgi:hypothetical protein